MTKRDILFAVAGIILTVAGISLYSVFRSPSGIDHTDTMMLVGLNNIGEQRANAIVVAARVVSPAVVSISVIQTKVVATSPFFSPFDEDFFKEFFRGFAPEYYYKKQVKNLGSGFIISSDGYILTNEHVVAHATEIDVTLPDGRQYKADIIAADVTHDLALLKIEAKGLPSIRIGDSDELMIGEWVIALGNPFGFLLEDTRPTVTVGVVSALGRMIKSTREDRFYKNMIQTDAAINPGNSGGPLVNVLGEVVGINTAIFTTGGGSEGIGFARPINDATKFINEARQHGRLRTPWIGLWIKDSASPAEEPGVVVSAVDEGSSSDKAGIKEGDRITAVDEFVIRNVADWDRLISNVYVDDTLRVTCVRDQQSKKINLVVEEFLKPAGLEKNIVIYGVHTENINSQLARKYGIDYTEGVVVVQVEPGSVGKKIGLRPGDVILMVGNMRVHTVNEFQKAFQSAPRAHFIIDRQGKIIQVFFGS